MRFHAHAARCRPQEIEHTSRRGARRGGRVLQDDERDVPLRSRGHPRAEPAGEGLVHRRIRRQGYDYEIRRPRGRRRFLADRRVIERVQRAEVFVHHIPVAKPLGELLAKGLTVQRAFKRVINHHHPESRHPACRGEWRLRTRENFHGSNSHPHPVRAIGANGGAVLGEGPRALFGEHFRRLPPFRNDDTQVGREAGLG
jgi:hypothetical protein